MVMCVCVYIYVTPKCGSRKGLGWISSEKCIECRVVNVNGDVYVCLYYGVATISGLLKIISLFCRI